MAPGVNDGPRNTGTLPKSNRRNNRNRDAPSINPQTVSRSVYHGRTQHPNNLLDWQPVSDRETVRTTKNSNTRSTASAPSISYQDFADILSYGSTSRQYNYTGDDCSQAWQEMAQPIDSRTQSPPQLQATKPTNVDKMPDRRQVESRLYQIRDYIRVTSTMMESLNQSSDPRARTQHEKLSRMVEDLCDSETKLAKLLEDYNVRGISDESGDHQPLRSDQMKRFVELLDVLGIQERILVTNSNRRNSESGKEEGEENGNEPLEAQLRRKMEASQRKLAELQEHQANLVGMQLQVRERLNAARQAQQALLQQENEAQAANVAPTTSSPAWETSSRSSQPPQAETDEIDDETALLRSKLTLLQNKKKHMDQLMVELQAVELSDRASVSSESSRNAERDKSAELEVLKAQLAHLKSLMEQATRVREVTSSIPEPEQERIVTVNSVSDNADVAEDESGAGASYNSFDRQSETDDLPQGNSQISKDRPTVEQIQAVTRELKEQSTLLQAARAELRRLKQASGLQCINPAPASLPGSTPPSSVPNFPGPEKKQTNTNNNNNNNNNSNNHHQNGDVQQAQTKKRQMEELVRKEQSHSSSVNRDVTNQDWSSRRGSNSQMSHTSTPANVWPHPNVAAGGSNEPSVDGISSSENLLDIGPQITAVENGFGINWWNEPTPPVTQPQNGPVGSAEYYRQLLMGSQAQQLQMMGTTMQQCCQLLWAQQRELQSMRSAITQLQQQFRQSQPRVNENPENREEYSNLSRSVHHLGNTLDASLPPSSSLPNLVSLPNSSPAPSHNSAVAPANPSPPQPQQPQQHHQQQPPQQQHQQQQQQQQHHHHQYQHHQQLNNQVPPGNRANNYWDNFRSYSRQNLLSGNPKTITDATQGPSGNSVTSTNTASSSVNSSLVREKRNREHGADNLPLASMSSAEAQYSLNLQLQSNLQTQERDPAPVARINILSNEAPQQQQMENFWEELPHSTYRPVAESNEDLYSLRHMSGEMRDILGSLVAANRRRPDYLVIILREIKAISDDHRLRPRLLRSLRALQDTQSLSNPLNEVTDQTASESCQSSDEDSDFGAQASALPTSNPTNNQLLLTEFLVPLHSSSAQMQQQSGPSQLPEHLEFEAMMPLENVNSIPSASSLTPGYNEDLAEADQSRPEASSSQQGSPEDGNNESDNNKDEGQHGAMAHQVGITLETAREVPDGVDDDDEGAMMENSILDRIPTRLFHH